MSAVDSLLTVYCVVALGAWVFCSLVAGGDAYPFGVRPAAWVALGVAVYLMS